MKPLKVRDLIPSFAMDMGRSVDEVQAVISFYYKTVRQKLSNLESVNVQLENLGTFYIKERALHKQIEKNENYADRLSDNDIKEYERKLEVKKKTDKMRNMVDLVLEEKQRRKEVINKRFNNEPGS